MDLWELFGKLYQGRSQKLSWDWIPDDNIDDGVTIPPFQARQCYVVVRLAEMFLRDQRILWKKFYPMVHGFIRHKPREFSEVAGPNQLKELGTANLDRLVGLAYPLTEPIVYNGADLDLLVGLYAVPGQDAAKVLLGSLGELSKLAGVSAEVALKVADVVKAGVEGLLQIDGNSLQLGARDTLKLSAPGIKGKLAKAGYLLSVNAPSDKVDYKQLWVQKGRLFKGTNPVAAEPFADYDYMLVEIEHRDTREDWRSLPAIQKHEDEFDAAITSGVKVDDIKSKLDSIWPKFTIDVRNSIDLTDPDKDRVIISVRDALNEKLRSVEHPREWEKRSIAFKEVGLELRPGFDLLTVEDAFAGRTEGEIAELRRNADRLMM